MRTRNKSIPIRVTEKELEIIDKKAARAKLSRTDYLIFSALNKEISVCEDLKPILRELSRIGNNINQLTMLANMRCIDTVDLEELTEELGALHATLCKMMIAKREKNDADREAGKV